MKPLLSIADIIALPTLANDRFLYPCDLSRSSSSSLSHYIIYHILNKSTFTLAQPPSIGVPVSLVQWVKLLVSLLTSETQFISKFEEIRSNVDEPFGVNSADFPHVLLGSKDQFVIDDPFWFLVEKSTAWMDIYLVIVN